MHEEYLKKENKRIEHLAETFRKDFLKKCALAKDDGFLSLDTDLARVADRLNAAHVQVADPLLREDLVNGVHDGVNIELRPGRTDEELRKTYFHEAAHTALSGRKTKMLSLGDEGVPQTIAMSIQKVGIRLEKNNSYRYYAWIDEAITEIIALRLAGVNDSKSYVPEREELQKLIDDGIEWQIFIAAYQEEYILDENVKMKLPKMKKMFNAIQKIRHKKSGSYETWLMRMEKNVFAGKLPLVPKS